MGIYTDEQIWELASEPDIDLELAHVLAMSDDEIRASLQSRGHDLRVLEAQAMIMMGLPRKSASFRAGFIGAGAGATISAIAASVMMAVTSQPPVLLTAASAPPPTPAESLRQEGLAACAKSQWDTCIERLDKARSIDPDGDEQAQIREARERARRALSDR